MPSRHKGVFRSKSSKVERMRRIRTQHRRKAVAALTAGLVFLGGAGDATNSLPTRYSDLLLQRFRSPPQAAKPRVWWHWMNGNISKEGIRRDLEWMHRVGLAGGAP